MKILLIIAAAGVTYMTGPRTTLDAQEVGNLGIRIDVQNYNRELTVEPGPLFFRIDLSAFTTCKVRDLELNTTDLSGRTIFGATISSYNGFIYPFRLAEEHVDYSTIGIACDSGPDVLDHVYFFELGDVVNAP